MSHIYACLKWSHFIYLSSNFKSRFQNWLRILTLRNVISDLFNIMWNIHSQKKNSFSFPLREQIFLKELVKAFDESKSGNKILNRSRLLWAPSVLTYWIMKSYDDSIFTDFHNNKYSYCPDAVCDGKWAKGNLNPLKLNKINWRKWVANVFFSLF